MTVMKCEGHAASVMKEETAVITIDVKPDAVKSPEVETILKSFGFSKVEECQYQDDEKEEKTISYEMTVSDAEKAKSLTKRFPQKLPKLIDYVDRKVIDNVIDEMSVTKELAKPTEQKRQSCKCKIVIIIKIAFIKIKIVICKKC